MPQQTPLDPKLKEAYERVMSTEVTQTKPVEQPVSQAKEPKKEEKADETVSVHFSTAPETKKKNGISPLIIGVGIVALLIVYTFFWIIFFHIQLPFLPSLS